MAPSCAHSGREVCLDLRKIVHAASFAGNLGHYLESSFSAITAFNIFHLLEDIPVVLERLHGLLAPGGLLVSQTPCLGERNLLVRSLLGLAQRLGFAPPIRSLSFAELESLVSGCGFEILQNKVWDEKDAVQRVVARKVGGVRAHLGAAEAVTDVPSARSCL